MSEQLIIAVSQADPLFGRCAPDVCIQIVEPLPPWRGDSSLADLDRIFEADASRIEQALRDYLPGGTYDRLLGRMLGHKASHLRVPLGRVEQHAEEGEAR